MEPNTTRTKVGLFVACLILIIIAISLAGYIYKIKFTAQQKIFTEKVPTYTLPIDQEQTLESKTSFINYHDPVNNVSITYPSDWQIIETKEGFSVSKLISTLNESGTWVNVRLFYYVANNVPYMMTAKDSSISIEGKVGQTKSVSNCIETTQGSMECSLAVTQFNKDKPIITVGYGSIKQFSPPRPNNPRHAEDQGQLQQVNQDFTEELHTITSSFHFN